MTIERANLVLRVYNDWRRTNHEPCSQPFSAREIGEAIDIATDLLERNIVKAEIDSIIKAVVRETGVTEHDMLARGRQRENAEARAIVSWLAYHFTPMTLTAIGARLNRDHPTVIHYNRTVDGWLEQPKRNLRGARIIQKIINELEDGSKTDTDNLSRPA